jgi:hypothetical protein
MAAMYTNAFLRLEFAENGKRESILDDAQEIIRNLKENGFPANEATDYVNTHFIDLLSELLSGGIISRTVQEIGATPECQESPVFDESENRESTFTLKKELSVDLANLYPYIDVSVKAGPLELETLRFSFHLSGTVTLTEPSITVFRKKIVRASLGTLTPSFSLYYTSGGEDTLLHMFEKPFTFDEIAFNGTEPGEEREPVPIVAAA